MSPVVWVAVGLLQLLLPRSLQSSADDEWSQLSKMDLTRELVLGAKCVSFCLHLVSNNFSLNFQIFTLETQTQIIACVFNP